MRIVLIFSVLSHVMSFNAQLTFPDFLQGTWKIENKDVYEHWDKLNAQHFKGFSYKLVDKKMEVTEYLDLSMNGDSVIYTATVINQNQGKSISFYCVNSDSVWLFENLKHDFPKKISYQKLSENSVLVSVSDELSRGFSYKMERQFVVDSTIENPNYDSALAVRLGGDDYGMKSYMLVILKTGTNTSADKVLVADSFRGHLDNINRLVKEGKLIVAGPLGKNENGYRGVFILNNVGTIEDAKTLLHTDPAVSNGLLDFEIFIWYGSAALPEYLFYSDRIWRVKP